MDRGLRIYALSGNRIRLSVQQTGGRFYEAPLPDWQAIPAFDQPDTDRKLSLHRAKFFFNKAVTPGYDELILLRKWMIKNRIAEAVANGTEQFVFLGGSYDIRAFMTALSYPDLNVFELDSGCPRGHKINAIKNLPNTMGFGDVDLNQIDEHVFRVNQNLFCMDGRLNTHSIQETLFQYGFKSELKTLIIAENSSLYLDEEGHQKLLTELSELLDGEDELLLSFVSGLPQDQTEESVSRPQYRFTLNPADVMSFLDKFGFFVHEKCTDSTLLACLEDLSAAEYYTNNPGLRQEICCSLQKKPPEFRPLAMEEVQDIVISLPEKPEQQSSRSYCSLM